MLRFGRWIQLPVAILFLLSIALLNLQLPQVVNILPTQSSLDEWVYWFSSLRRVPICVLGETFDFRTRSSWSSPLFNNTTTDHRSDTVWKRMVDNSSLNWGLIHRQEEGMYIPLQIHTIQDVIVFRELTYSPSCRYVHKRGCNHPDKVMPLEEKVVGCIVSLADRWNDNFGHWINEGLPRLLLLPPFIRDECILSVSHNDRDRSRHAVGTLHQLFNISFARIRDTRVPMRGNVVHIPDTWQCGVPHPILIQHLWSHIQHLPHLQPCDHPPVLNRDHRKRIVYIQRRQRHSLNPRWLENEPQVWQLLESHCLDFSLEILPSTDKDFGFHHVRYFLKEADVIIGMHGAGMANMIF